MSESSSSSPPSSGRVQQTARTLAALARRLSTSVALLASASGIAGAAIWLVLWWPVPFRVSTVLGALATAAVLLGPAAVLGLFYQGLRDLLALPERLSQRTHRTVEQSTEAARAVTADASGLGGRLWTVAQQIWALRTVLLENRGLLLRYGALLRFLTPAFLLLVVLATAVTLLLIPLAVLVGLSTLVW